MGSKQSVFVGERFQNKDGLWFEVVEYITGKKIRVKFDVSGFSPLVEGKQIRLGNLEDALSKYPQPGQIYEMSQNGPLEIIEYGGAKEVTVRFLNTGFQTTCEMVQLRRGTVKDGFLPRVCGVGYVGDGHHKGYNSKHEPEWAYLKWQNMLERCYDPWNAQTKEIYEDCEVVTEWFNYQNFAEWAKQQKGYGNIGWALEKDIIKKGNKIYSPENCCFVPKEVNNLMLKSEAARSDRPIGVSVLPSGNYGAIVSKYGKPYRIGTFPTIEQAFAAYKAEKEDYLKEQAEKWKDQIDPRAYEALINYKVEITD